MTTKVLKQPFSNLQLELLKLYSRPIPDEDLLQIKRLIGQYLADKASDLADEVWDKKGLTEEKILNQHRRIPSSQKTA